jgi:hypothetical protein
MTLPEQLAGLQGVFSGNRVQLPKPSQSPVVAQVLLSWAGHAESDWPAGMNLQRPKEPTRLHDTQAPLQATLQQTPSVQKPEVQSLSFAHLAPFSFKPQLRFTHCWPAMHWELVVQSKAHCPVP